jgi:MOSC domain-containing protein YiiM
MKVPAVLQIFTAPERGAPMVSSRQVMVHREKGIEGDRYFKISNRKGPDYQLTLIEIENIDAFNAKYGARLPPEALRRNVVTTGVRLNDLCGKQFKAGALLLEGLELCEPCRLVKIRTDPRALEFFAAKGGLRARVLTGGVLEVGASIEPVVQLSHEDADRQAVPWQAPRAR